jgi:hypothetical protein
MFQCHIINNKLDIIKGQLLNKMLKNISNSNDKKFFIKKIGKKKEKFKGLSINKNNKNHIHDKFAFDNICQKIKVLYHKFLINLINDFIFKVYGGFQKFKIRKISSKITQNVTKKFNQILSNCTLKSFFTNKISTKYRKFSEDKNSKSIQKLNNLKPKLNELFNLKYSFVYKHFFLYGNREELKNKFGLNEKTLIFRDYIEKMKLKENNEYINKFEEVAKGKLLEMFCDNNYYFENINFLNDI